MRYLVLAVRDLGNPEFESKGRYPLLYTDSLDLAEQNALDHKKRRGDKYGCLVWDILQWKEVFRVNSWNY